MTKCYLIDGVWYKDYWCKVYVCRKCGVEVSTSPFQENICRSCGNMDCSSVHEDGFLCGWFYKVVAVNKPKRDYDLSPRGAVEGDLPQKPEKPKSRSIREGLTSSIEYGLSPLNLILLIFGAISVIVWSCLFIN